MSADNYIYVRRDGDDFEVFHCFASNDEAPLGRPMFIGTRDEALRFAHTWARDNVCEYGVATSADLWDDAEAVR